MDDFCYTLKYFPKIESNLHLNCDDNSFTLVCFAFLIVLCSVYMDASRHLVMTRRIFKLD